MELKNNPVIEMNKIEEDVLTHFSEMLELYCEEMNMCTNCNLCKIIQNSNATYIIEDILNAIKFKIVDDIEITTSIEGHWDKTEENFPCCSVCKIPSYSPSNYCPNCGAKMKHNS